MVCDLGVEVATVGVVHDDAQAALVHEGLLVRDDVGVSHSLEHVHLEAKKKAKVEPTAIE